MSSSCQACSAQLATPAHYLLDCLQVFPPSLASHPSLPRPAGHPVLPRLAAHFRFTWLLARCGLLWLSTRLKILVIWSNPPYVWLTQSQMLATKPLIQPIWPATFFFPATLPQIRLSQPVQLQMSIHQGRQSEFLQPSWLLLHHFRSSLI